VPVAGPRRLGSPWALRARAMAFGDLPVILALTGQLRSARARRLVLRGVSMPRSSTAKVQPWDLALSGSCEHLARTEGVENGRCSAGTEPARVPSPMSGRWVGGGVGRLGEAGGFGVVTGRRMPRGEQLDRDPVPLAPNFDFGSGVAVSGGHVGRL
jgi:hypothetical protein